MAASMAVSMVESWAECSAVSTADYLAASKAALMDISTVDYSVVHLAVHWAAHWAAYWAAYLAAY